ncbi:MAG: hypothetical protein J6U28_04520, partial [Bacteroidales bacterium]|nr:hypothetical protein [Bacteroidales bacterium]
DDTFKNRKGQHRWGAASYVQSIRFCRIPDFCGTGCGLSANGIGISPVGFLPDDLGIEAAIGAEAPAERDMDINHLR